MNARSTMMILPALLGWSMAALGQISAPRAEAVFGGRINAIAALPLGADSSRIFITTESANSAFYADVAQPAAGVASFGAFQPVSGMGGAAGLGGGIRSIAAHAASGHLYFIHNNQVKRVHPSGGGISPVSLSGANSLLIVGDHLLIGRGGQLHFGRLDATGRFLETPGSPIAPPGLPPMGFETAVNPQSRRVYLFFRGSSPKLFRSNQPLDSLGPGLAFADISPAGLGSGTEWSAFGVAPDGRLFIAGSDFGQKKAAYSDDESSWTLVSMGMGGAPGTNLSFGGDSAKYAVYFASAYNPEKGAAGFWRSFGQPGGSETHPNDGAVLADPVGPRVVYMTTDQGIGASVDNGSTIFEINEGVEAVQVNDFAMHLSNKNVAWIASKAGLRKVSNYQLRPVWTPAIFPNGDGSPYNAVAMAGTDSNRVYAGNLRVYKSYDGGNNWRNLFSAEQAPYNFPSFGTPTTGAAFISSLAVCEYDTSIVFAGYQIDRQEEGGLFYSHDGGTTWGQLLLHAAAPGFDVDVADILFNLEGGDTVAYVGVRYDLSSPAGRSVYRLVKNGSGWTASQDMDASGTSVGYAITATIRSLARSATGDTLLACGTDAGTNHPVAYAKILSADNRWTPLPTSGLPFSGDTEGRAITLGPDTVYIAVGPQIYYLAAGSSTWELGYAYPAGTQIQFLFYDELLVGTGTGLYGHTGLTGSSASLVEPLRISRQIRIQPNPVAQGGQVLITVPGQVRGGKLSLWTAQGRLVWSREVSGNSARIDGRLIPRPGIYLLQWQTDSQLFMGKLEVQ